MSPLLVTILVVASTILTVASVIPYLYEIVKGTTKPRIVSWFVWTVLTAIAAVASLSDGQYPTAILLFAAAIETGLVVILGWKHGDRKIETLDIVCLIGAVVGVVLWQVFNSPAIAVISTVSIDLVGGIPTLIHAYKKPHEETALTFFLAFAGGFLTLLAVSDWRITSVAYPIYLVVINLVFTALVLVGQRRKRIRTHDKGAL
ncbi:MAG: hypothetical protein JWM52_731 [Candidatus Saccharibacteria bacterium]|nr:hypothetical protein [Candidatus Saccharibacteria bacterium]